MQTIRVEVINRYYVWTAADPRRYVEVLPYSPIQPGTHAIFVADKCDNEAVDADVGTSVCGNVANWRMQGEGVSYQEQGSIVIDTKGEPA